MDNTTTSNAFLNGISALLAKPIKKSTAREYAKHYQKDQPADGTRSIFFDRTLIDRIVEDHNSGKNFSGIRVYLARYSDYKDEADLNTPVDKKLWNKNTVIVAFTTAKSFADKDKDIDGEYYNYGSPCPPSTGCEEDESLFKP